MEIHLREGGTDYPKAIKGVFKKEIKMEYHINPDEEWVKEFKKELRLNNKYCPSKLERNKTTKCICKEFKEQEHGWCSCGLYYKD